MKTVNPQIQAAQRIQAQRNPVGSRGREEGVRGGGEGDNYTKAQQIRTRGKNIYF